MLFGPTPDHSQIAVEQKDRTRLFILLPLAGLLSGLITVALSHGSSRTYWIGGVFGVVVGIGLLLTERLHGAWKAAVVFVPAAIAFLLSLSVASITQLLYLAYLVSPETDSPANSYSLVALFFGGIVGGFLILAMFSTVCYPKAGIRNIALNSLTWSPSGGILSLVGWLLGPVVGVAVWYLLDAVGLTPFTQGAEKTLDSDKLHMISLFVVWQTGMGVVLSRMLERRFKRS